MLNVNLKEARKRIGDLVNAAERGESVIITRRGKKVARIVSANERSAGGLPELAKFRASIAVKGKPLSRIVIAKRRESRY